MLTGSHALSKYKELLKYNDYDDDDYLNSLRGIPLENNFSEISALVHFDKGANEEDLEVRYIDGILYPSLPEALMSPYISNNNYLTSMTLGCLQDLGFDVNYDSTYVDDTIYSYPSRRPGGNISFILKVIGGTNNISGTSSEVILGNFWIYSK